MQGNLFLSSLSSAFSLGRFATTCDRRSTIWFLSWLSWISAPSKTALIPIDDTPQNFQVGTAVDIACDFVGLSRRRSSRHHRLEARNGTIEIGSQLLFGLGPNIVSAGCSCMCLAPGPQVASRESGRPVLPNSALICSRPERRALHAVTQLIQAIPFSPGPWRDFVMAAVERDPLREIRKGKIVIEQRREFGTSLVHHRRPITKGEPCVWRENPQKVAVITLTNCLFPDWPLTLCI